MVPKPIAISAISMPISKTELPLAGIFASAAWEAVFVGVGVPLLGVGVAVGLSVGVAVGARAMTRGVGVAVGLRVGVAVGLSVGVGVFVAAGETDGAAN